MPIACDPEAAVPYSLPHDKDKPADVRPTFLVRALSRRGRRRTLEAVEAARREPDDAKCFAMVVDTIRPNLVGWRNMPHPFDAAKLDDLLDEMLTEQELWDLAWGSPYAGEIAEDDRKNSEGQSRAIGADPAAAANESASSEPRKS